MAYLVLGLICTPPKTAKESHLFLCASDVTLQSVDDKNR